ncbi:MFS transporter [Alicyclobacillus acidoterrestris]|nr:MFS transporter [Alicyclobacillus acidoterrestris]
MAKNEIQSVEKVISDSRVRWLPKAHPVSWLMLLVTTLAMLLCSIDRQILPTVLPGIMKTFHLNSVQAGWLNSMNYIGSFVGAIVIGYIADRIGRGHRRAWSWMVTAMLTVVSGLATFFTTGIGGLKFWRLIMGFGTGSMEPVNVALVSEFWQKEDRGFAVGAHQTGMPFGQFVGPVLMGAILAVGSWRATFLWIPIIGIVIMLLQSFVGTKRNEQRVYNWITERQLTVPVDHSYQPNRNPLKHFAEAVRDRNVGLGLLTNFMYLWAEMGVATFLTLDLTSKVGLPLSEAAVISGASGITGWMGQIVWGAISDKLGRKFCLRILTVGFTACILCCMFINSAATAWLILIIWGIFRNSPYAVLYAMLVDSAPKSAGASLGLLVGVGLGLSGALVTPVAGYFIQHFGWHWDYVMLAAVCLLTFIPMSLMRETSGDKASV